MKVAILGTAQGHQDAPFDDPSWDEIWWLNDAYRLYPDGQLPRATAWWEIHGDTPLTRARRPGDHFERISTLDIPVYYLQGDPPAPNARRIDVEALAAIGRDYFACTNAYQIPEAMRLGATEIGLWGIPLAANREVIVERPCVSYWLGLAEGRGVKVHVHHCERIGLLRQPHRYAFHDQDEREDAYWAAMRFADSLNYWLPYEAQRIASTKQEAVTC